MDEEINKLKNQMTGVNVVERCLKFEELKEPIKQIVTGPHKRGAVETQDEDSELIVMVIETLKEEMAQCVASKKKFLLSIIKDHPKKMLRLRLDYYEEPMVTVMKTRQHMFDKVCNTEKAYHFMNEAKYPEQLVVLIVNSTENAHPSIKPSIIILENNSVYFVEPFNFLLEFESRTRVIVNPMQIKTPEDKQE